MNLLSHYELADVLLCLDRLSLDSMLFVSRKARTAVSTLPSSSALRLISSLRIRPRYRGKIPRLFDRIRIRKILPHVLNGYLHDDAYKLQPSFKRRMDSLERCCSILGNAFRTSCICDVYLNFRAAPVGIADLYQPANEQHGSIQRLELRGGFRELEPVIFERMPFLSGTIHSIEVVEVLSPQQQSETFMQNCINQGVRVLKAARKSWKPAEIPKGVSDVRDDTILDFCFRRTPMRNEEQYGERCRLWHVDATADTVELWLNYVNFAEDFLQRFVQASDDSITDHKVRLFLCGENFDKLDASGSDDANDGWERAHSKSFRFWRKCFVWVGINVELKFMVILRCPLQDAPPQKALEDNDDYFRALRDPYLDDWVNPYDSSCGPRRKLRKRIETVVRELAYYLFHP